MAALLFVSAQDSCWIRERVPIQDGFGRFCSVLNHVRIQFSFASLIRRHWAMK
jgi:hypothetical protein